MASHNVSLSSPGKQSFLTKSARLPNTQESSCAAGHYNLPPALEYKKGVSLGVGTRFPTSGNGIPGPGDYVKRSDFDVPKKKVQPGGFGMSRV